MEIRIKAGVPTDDAISFRDMLAGMYSQFSGNEVIADEDSVKVIVDDNYDVSAEYGVHRLVRISPFDPQHRRHTSFALVEIDGQYREEQVCSYVLHPYTMAKNYINGKEVDDVFLVLNGNPLGIEKGG